MPFVSQSQRAFFNAHRAELEKKGVNVEEWNQSSKGMKLPEHKTKKKKGMATHVFGKRYWND